MKGNLKSMVQLIKRYYSHILLVLITIIVINFIYKGASTPTFTETFNFGSTITSIILSVIAIIYTLIDSLESKTISSKIIDSADKLTVSVDSFDEITQKINKSAEKLDKVGELENLLLMIEKNIKRNINESKALKEAVISMVGSNSNNEVDSKVCKSIVSEEDISEIIRKFSLSMKRNCFFLYKALEYNQYIDFFDFNTFYNLAMQKEDLPYNDIYQGLYDTLNILSALNLMKFKVEENRTKVEYINNTFKQELLKYIPKPGYFADAPQARFYGTVYDYFDNLNAK